MKILKDRILKDGRCYPGGILKVDNFINHQMDPILMKSIGVEFVRRFASTPINKIITVEASGIAPAIIPSRNTDREPHGMAGIPSIRTIWPTVRLTRS